MREDQFGALFRSQEFKRGQRRRDALVTERHRRGDYNAAVRHYVLIAALVRKQRAWKYGAGLEAIPCPLTASGSQIHLELLDVVAFAFRKPGAFFCRVGESREDSLRRGRIAAFDDECVVNCGSIFHTLPSFLK